ncbi:MAG: DoxX family protein [Chitinophagaceae bacterium]
MKSTKIIYWTTTILFSAFMIFSAIPDIAMNDEAKQFMRHLGYPDYFMPFIGIAKLLGSIAILTPGLKKIKEWAYAGLFFDLLGAVYSNIMTDGFQIGLLVLIPVFAAGIVSYFYNQKIFSNKQK